MRERARLATSKGSKSFYFATRFFPPEMAEAAWAVYWFCRTTDDMVDEADTPPDLAVWAEQLRRALDGATTGNAVLDHFAATARRYQIPAEYPLDLIAGVRDGPLHAPAMRPSRICACTAIASRRRLD